ncbi:hypothetical protein FRC02_000146 [Tulasnella sp. 418]|nr:hypothetical protein FRC02_000146 [Tulasnella sp. 418]
MARKVHDLSSTMSGHSFQNHSLAPSSPQRSPAKSETDHIDIEEDGSFSDLDSGHPDEVDSVTGRPIPARPKQRYTGHKPPNTEEMLNIKEANNLFKSNAFKLQIDALLSSVRPTADSRLSLEGTLVELHKLLLSLPMVEPQYPYQAARHLEEIGIAVPFPVPRPMDGAKWRVAFEKPADIKVVGSWGSKVSIKQPDGRGFGVDLCLEMPDTLFQEKDYLDNRFFHKRAYYLAVVAQQIKSSGLSLDVAYQSPQEDLRRTRLVLRPKNSPLDDTITIYIHLSLSSSCPIPFHRLSPSHGNIRCERDSSQPSAITWIPSPLYNNQLLQAYTPIVHLLYIYKFTSEFKSFADALALLRVWANQRGYGEGKKSVMGFESLGNWWGFLLGYLMLGNEGDGKTGARFKPLGRGLSSYQLFRGALDFLAHHDFVNQPACLKSLSERKLDQWAHEWTGKPVFIDSSSGFNFLAGVPESSLKLLRHDASTTLAWLNNQEDPFELTFLKDLRDACLKFDFVFRIALQGLRSQGIQQPKSSDHGSYITAALKSVPEILAQALGDRVKHCVVIRRNALAWQVSKHEPGFPEEIEIGLILDPLNAFRLIDEGPLADDSESCAQFRKFWGSKAELRRFKDGRIIECVVWNASSPSERMNIPMWITQHILGHHFNLTSPDIATTHSMLYDLLTLPSDIMHHYSRNPAGTHTTAMAALDNLTRTLKVSKNLPLSLVSLRPISSHLRHTSTFEPVSINPEQYGHLPACAMFIPAMEVIIEFEKSSRWPDDLAAIQKVKLALLEAIANTLLSTKAVIKGDVVLDSAAQTLEDNCSLEILTAEAYAFRLRIHHDREKTLLERQFAPSLKQATTNTQYDQLKSALKLHSRRFIHGPRHHAAISILHHRFSAFSITTRLVQRWLGAHLLAPHIPQEMIELLCAQAYLVPCPYGPPATGHAGFIRVVWMLKEWNFALHTAFVPLYTTSTNHDSKEVIPNAPRSRERSGMKENSTHTGWKIATEEDPTGVVFGTVDDVVALRVRQVSSATWEYLKVIGEVGSMSVKDVFKHPTTDYDFIIHLNPSLQPRYFQSLNADPSYWTSHVKYKNVTPKSLDQGHIRVDFDPFISFFNDLKAIYSGVAVFFFDPHGGTQIAGAWNPQALLSQPFKVFSSFSCVPDRSADNSKKYSVRLNTAAILAEIKRMGADLVRDVEVLA